MADDWEEDEPAKQVSKTNYNNNNNNSWSKGGGAKNDGWGNETGAKKDDGWGSGSGAKKDDGWGSGGGAKKEDDGWGTGGGAKDDGWGSGGGSKNDDWGNSNGGGGGGGRRDFNRSASGGGRTQWFCLGCQGKNFGHRTECFKCHEPKGDAVDVPADENRGGGGGGKTQWICLGCQGKNFGHRTECFKCHEPKGDAVDVPAEDNRGGGGGGFGGAGGARPGDWSCSCGQSNFASRSECFKCKEPKGDAQGADSTSAAPRSNGSSGGDKRANDWKCPNESCGNSNFSFRQECQKCNEKRPEGCGFTSEKPKEFYIPPDIDGNELFTQGISTGIHFDKYKNIPVKITGDEPLPKEIKSFETSGLDPFLLSNVKKSGYTDPTPIQRAAIPTIMAGRDLMACAQTGSGKTAAFLLPIINTLLTDNQPLEPGNPQVLIMSPTRELAIQIHFEATKFASDSILKCVCIYGGTSTRHDSNKVGAGLHILVATPGRLIDFVDKGFIQFSNLRFLVLDEADRMLDMGFKETIEKVCANKTMPPIEKRKTLMFSATFPTEIQRLAGKFLHKYVFVTIGVVGGACKEVQQNIFKVARFDKRNKLMEILNESDPKGTMVFVETKRNADFLASFLSESKHKTTSIHGDREQRQREEAINDFKSGRMKVLIATSVAARGLDIPNVVHVINFDLPKTIEDYVHRIGRTGRVGNEGKATSFFDEDQDSALADDLVRVLKEAEQNVPDFLAVGGAGGGGGREGNSFGGRDIRNQSSAVPEAHGGGDADENW